MHPTCYICICILHVLLPPPPLPIPVSCSPNWVSIYGESYYRGEFLFCGWQANDLPIFGKITDIFLIVGCTLVTVQKYSTERINNHLQAYLISPTFHTQLVVLSTLPYLQTLTAHTFLGDGNLYISMRSYVLDTSKPSSVY